MGISCVGKFECKIRRTTMFTLMILASVLTAHIGECLFHMKIGILYDHFAENYYDIVHYTVEMFAAKADHGSDLVVDTVEFNLDYEPNAYDYLLERDLTVVVIAAKKLNCQRLASVKNQLSIFVVTGSFTNCDEYDGVNSMFYLYPSDSVVLNSVLLAADKYKWRSAIVLGEKNEEFDFTFANMQQARERGVETVALEVSYQKDILKKTLLTAKREGIRSYVLMSQMHHVDVFLTVATEVGITDKNYHWFIPNVFVTPQVLEPFVQAGMTISLLYSPILSPLIHKIDEKEGSNSSEIYLMNEVVSSLTLLALEVTFTACEEALREGCLDNLGDNTTCKPRHEDLASYLRHMPTTAASTTPIPVTTASPVDEASTANGGSGARKRRSVLLATSEEQIGSSVAPTAMLSTHCENCFQKTYLSSICSKKRCMHSKNTKIPVSVSTTEQAAEKHPIRKRRAAPAYSVTLDEASTAILNPNSDCLIYDWNDEFIAIAASITDATLYNQGSPGNDTNDNSISTYTKSLSTIPVLNTRLDTCAFTSINQWAYGNGTCSHRLMRNSEERLSNVLYVVEYVGKEDADKEPVVVGAFNSENRSYISSTYEELHLYNVYLPQADFLIGAIHHPPWLTWTVDEETGALVFSGYLYEVLEHLAESMGFTYQLLSEYDFVGDLMHVDQVEKHMFDLFDNNTVDFFLHAKSVRGNRLGQSDVVYLTTSFQYPSMYLLTKRVENTEAVSIWQFMLPFREESWIVFWSSFILVSLLMAYYNSKNPNEYDAIAHTFGPDSSPSDHLGILNSLWFNFATICGQGADIVPRSSACTVLTGTWWLFLLLVVSAYTANMTAFMTQVNNGGIETLDELANQKEFAYGIMETNAMYRLFLPQAKASPFTTIWEYLQKNRGNAVFQKQEDAFDKILEGNFFYIAEFESAVEAMATSCDFDVKGDGFYQYQFSLPFPRGSVYIPVFNDHIRKLADDGVLADLEKKWFTIEKNCEEVVTEESLENQLDIKAFIGMYVFLALGVTGGMIICLMETGWIKYGGISGLFGRAGVYELDADRKEIQRANNLMEKEFESWEGGWGVWKFKEWKPEDDLGLVEAAETPRPISRRTGCKICGRPFAKHLAPRLPSELEIRNSTHFKSPLAPDKDDSNDSGRDSAFSDVLKAGERDQLADNPKASVTPNVYETKHKIPAPIEEKIVTVRNDTFYPELPKREDMADKSTTAKSVGLPKIVNVTTSINENLQKSTATMVALSDIPAPEIPPSKSKVDVQKPQVAPQPLLKVVPPAFAHRLPLTPFESDCPPSEERMESSLSSGSTYSHSSLASGTLSFISESDDSVSTIHPRTPYELSPSPSSIYTGSTLSRAFQSSFRSEASCYSTTSYEPESGYSRQSYWSHRSMRETPISYLSELTEDARSDVTVISRKPPR